MIKHTVLRITADKNHPIVASASLLSDEIDLMETKSAGGEVLVTVLIPIAMIMIDSAAREGFKNLWQYIVSEIKFARRKRNSLIASIHVLPSNVIEITPHNVDKITFSKNTITIGDSITISTTENRRIP